MPGKSFLPYRESELLLFAQNAHAVLDATPDAFVGFGLTQAQFDTFQSRYSAFDAAYITANHPDTRTPTAVSQKNLAKAAMVSYIREMVRLVQAHPGLTDDQRVSLGITVPDVDPSPVPRPVEQPGLSVRLVKGRVIMLQLTREDGRRAKPEGVASAAVYRFVGGEPPAGIGGFEYVGSWSTTRPEVVMPEDTPVGTKVWVSAAWANRKQQLGFACPPVSATTNTLAMSTSV